MRFLLSPLLFALFMAELGQRLTKKGTGVVVGDKRIPALFYADDVVLLCDSEDDMIETLRVVQEFLTERAMDLNYGNLKYYYSE